MPEVSQAIDKLIYEKLTDSWGMYFLLLFIQM
jgi:hypothetical protein